MVKIFRENWLQLAPDSSDATNRVSAEMMMITAIIDSSIRTGRAGTYSALRVAD